jgi:hypothetical protein
MTNIKMVIPYKTTYNYKVYNIAKIIKKDSKTPLTKRTELLGLVSFDICRPLLTLYSKYRYFLNGYKDYSWKS